MGNVVQECVISGNGNGLLVVGSFNVVLGNIIGLDLAGKEALCNTGFGIWCEPGSDNTTIANNTISGNRAGGVSLSSRGNVIRGNLVGLDVTGIVEVVNGASGITCNVGSNGTVIANNTIAISGNRGPRCEVASGGNIILGNIPHARTNSRFVCGVGRRERS